MTYSRLATAGLAATLLIFSGSLVAQQKEVAFESAGDYLKLPADIHFGEVAGVATTTTGNVWVYNQGGGLNLTVGAARLHPSGGARLFEFDRSGKFLRELGSTNEERPYGFRWAQGVRVDPQNNVWVVDRGSRTITKFDPSGRILMILGRTPEAIGEIGSSAGAGPAGGAGRGGAVAAAAAAAPRELVSPETTSTSPPILPGTLPATSSSPTGTRTPASPSSTRPGGSRSPGAGPVLNPASSILPTPSPWMPRATSTSPIWATSASRCSTTTARSRARFKNVGAPRAICISPGAQQFLYSSDSNPTEDPFLNGEIYKMQLDGTVVGRIGRAGKQFKEFGMVNAIDCRDPNTLYVAELMNWRVQKLTLQK